MSSLNKLRRWQVAITKIGMWMQFKHHVVVHSSIKNLVHSEIILRGRRRMTLIQINPFGYRVESKTLLGCHLLLATTALLLRLLLFVFWSLLDMTITNHVSFSFFNFYFYFFGGIVWFEGFGIFCWATQREEKEVV